ncbi:MAG: zinc ribbon domain-containing protein [Nitrososphaerales archaeon]
MAKAERFIGENVDPERLATRIETYLQDNQFEVAFSKDPKEPASWFFIQARKAGALRTVAGARRSTDIAIEGEPNNFDVTIGTGEWGKNLLTSAPLFIIPIVGIAATVTKLYTAKKFESNLWNYIRDQVRFLKDSSLSKTSATQLDTRMYACDYVEGYPGWGPQVEGGKLLLERQKGGKNRIVFRADSKEIVIPAEQVSEASIIKRKKGLHEHELMVQISCSDPTGRTSKTIFNLNDDIIRGVLAGINELVGEDKVLRSFEQVSVITDVKFCTSCGVQIAKAARFCSECGAGQQ